MRMLKLAIPAGIAAVGFLLCTTVTYGKPEYMKKENLKSCTGCHSKMGMTKDSPNLNDLGKCYSENDHSLAKCKVPADAKK
jgi:hypothetical protein